MTRDLFLGIWAFLALLLVAIEVLARRGIAPWATARQFLRAMGRHDAVALVLLLGWMWLGWHLFAR